MSKVEITPLPPPAPCPGVAPPGEVWTCPCCHGLGGMNDGLFGLRPDGAGGNVLYGHTPPTPCRLCRGKRRVLVLPLPDEGAVP
jgi:hypothetical protein